jgi:hypothetical protein
VNIGSCKNTKFACAIFAGALYARRGGYWGFKTQSDWLMKILLGIGLPVLIAVVWGMFIVPKVTYPLNGVPFLSLELILFASGTLVLFSSGRPALGGAHTIILIMNKVLMVLWKQ